jgi:hypothetical protein
MNKVPFYPKKFTHLRSDSTGCWNAKTGLKSMGSIHVAAVYSVVFFIVNAVTTGTMKAKDMRDM